MGPAAQSLSVPLDLPNGRCSYMPTEGSPMFSHRSTAPQRASSLLAFKITGDLQNVEGFSPHFPKRHCKLGHRGESTSNP